MIGVIGFGRFGELTVRYLAQEFTVFVPDGQGKTERIHQAGGRPATLQMVCAQSIVVLCVPISVLQKVLEEIADYLKPGTIVVDVCSVKVYPVAWMKRLLPPNVSILPTHPMFGPDSAADSLTDRKIFIYPERIPDKQYQCIRDWLLSKGMIPIETTPDDHDRQIAVTLALTHFIGRTLSTFGAQPLPIDTEGYKRLCHILEVVENDTWQLFKDMHRYNPYASEARGKFMRAMQSVDERLQNIDFETGEPGIEPFRHTHRPS